MKFICFFLCCFLLIEMPTNAQNLIANPGFDAYYNYVDTKNNLVYKPDYWHYGINVRNHPIYYSTDRFLNDTIAPSFHPDAKLIKLGAKVNYISILILPDTQKAYTELKEPLRKGERYHLQVDII